MDTAQSKAILGLYGSATLVFALLVAVLFVGGGAAARVEAPATPPPPPESPAAVTVDGSGFGEILFDRDGRALYTFTADPDSESACAGACAATWPPYLVEGDARAGRGAEQALLATIERPDGGLQVTYAGRPLYHFVGDTRPGQVTCQGVEEFGGTWLVVRPDGGVVR